MTKNNFTALACGFKRTKPPDNADAYARQQWRDDVVAVIEVCEQINPRFRKDKFIAACGVPNLLME